MSITNLSTQLTLGRATNKGCLMRTKTNRDSGQYILVATNYYNEKWENGNVAYGYKSSDFGQTFSALNLPVSLGGTHRCTGVSMDSTGQYQVVLVSVANQNYRADVYVSSDYGSTWTLLFSETNSASSKQSHAGVAISDVISGSTSTFPCYILYGDSHNGYVKVYFGNFGMRYNA